MFKFNIGIINTMLTMVVVGLIPLSSMDVVDATSVTITEDADLRQFHKRYI
jgi:hypothetical protein